MWQLGGYKLSRPASFPARYQQRKDDGAGGHSTAGAAFRFELARLAKIA